MTERILPTGTITFLVSDMEGSTRLVQEVGPTVFKDILELHNETIRSACSKNGGTERGTQGDSFLVMFREASAGVAAAVDSQIALAAVRWPEGAKVGVRMGLHTGVGMLGGDDYVGIDVHRAARIASAAHGARFSFPRQVVRSLRTAFRPGPPCGAWASTSVRILPMQNSSINW